MKFNKTELEWVYEVLFDVFKDERWSFIKTFNTDVFKEIWFDLNFKESFYSISKKWVVRWMHFQLPPADHEKFVYVIQWSIKDVILDLRKNSITYGKYITLEISDQKNNWIIIPRGFAHWFEVLSQTAISIYMNTTVYDKNNDSWIRRDSFWFVRWINNPIISERDKNFISLDKFISPF